jgi:hypothetical protein
MMLALLAACAVPMLLESHDPVALLEGAMAPEGGPSFEGKSVVLVYEGDTSLVPIGGMLDDLHRAVTPVQQSYLMPEPGYVLYESLARALAERGAKVERRYDVARTAEPTGATVVGLLLRDIELHHWRTREGEFHLMRAQVRWTLAGQTADDVVTTKVAPSRDVFAACAGQLATSLRGRLP